MRTRWNDHEAAARAGDRHHRRLRGGSLQGRQEGRRRGGGGKAGSRSSIFSTTRCGCISSRWARCRCSRASRRWRSPSASRTPRSTSQKYINRFGFIARAYLDLARQSYIEGRERFDRVILDKKIESRERYMKVLPKLCEQLETAASELRQRHIAHLRRATAARTARRSRIRSFKKAHKLDPEALPEVLLQAEGHRGVRRIWRTRRIALIQLHLHELKKPRKLARADRAARRSITRQAARNRKCASG